jgi:transcriptional regulator with XRE-family HTH domain
MHGELKKHWTESSVDDFVYRISSDFVLQLETKIEKGDVSQKELACRLNVSDGRVSQVLNNPGNLTLKKVVEYARALGMKVAIVAYEDGDPENNKGPINSEIFNRCWKKVGSPEDFFALSSPIVTAPLADIHYYRAHYSGPIRADSGGHILSPAVSQSMTAGTNSFQVFSFIPSEGFHHA